MSAIAYFSSLKDFLAKAEFNSESAIFRLHYQFTVVVLIGSSVLLTAAEFFGSPIECISDIEPAQAINTYCWISSTFTIQDYYFRETGGQSAAPGVFSPDGYDEDEVMAKWSFKNYYQWVVFFLFFMAALCYFPKFIWNMSEGGLMEAIGKGLKKGLLYKDEDICGRKNIVVDYITTHIRLHNSYVFKYWFCEALCFVNIIGQLFLIDRFLGGEFMKYGLNVVDYSSRDQEDRVDPMIYVFPRMTKCHFHKFGPSGTVERHDSFCLLPLNILNEKTFIFLWFWYIILAILLSGLVLFRILLISMPGLRPRMMHQHSKIVPIEVLETFTKKTSIGDWWILYILSKNIDPMVYRDIMTRLAKEIETGASNNAYGGGGASGDKGREALHTTSASAPLMPNTT